MSVMGITQRYKLCQKERDQDYCKAPKSKNKSKFEERDAHISSLPRHDSLVLLSPRSLRSCPRASLHLPHLQTMLAMDLPLYPCTQMGISCIEIQGLLLNNFLSANQDAIGLAFTAWPYSHTTHHLETLLHFHHNINATRNYYNHFIEAQSDKAVCSQSAADSTAKVIKRKIPQLEKYRVIHHLSPWLLWCNMREFPWMVMDGSTASF